MGHKKLRDNTRKYGLRHNSRENVAGEVYASLKQLKVGPGAVVPANSLLIGSLK